MENVSIGGNAHLFSVEDLVRPTFCSLCGDFIWGLTKQGLKCRAFSCSYVVHKKCSQRAPENCPVSKNAELQSMKKTDSRMKVSEVTEVGVAHVFKEARFNKPTWCGYCDKWIRELMGKQGYRCKDCKMEIHKKCLANAETQTCIKVSDGDSNSPFSEAARTLGLSFAEIIIMEELYATLKGQVVTQRDGKVTQDCFTGTELVDVVVKQNAWRRSQCVAFCRALYKKKVIEPVLNFSSTTFTDSGELFKFTNSTVNEMNNALVKKKNLQDKEKKLAIISDCLNQVHSMRGKIIEIEKYINKGVLLPDEIEPLIRKIGNAIAKESTEVNFRKVPNGSAFGEILSKFKVLETKLARSDMDLHQTEQMKIVLDNVNNAFQAESLFKPYDGIYSLENSSDESWMEKNSQWFKKYFQGETYTVYQGKEESGTPILALLKLEEGQSTSGAITILRGLICTNWGIRKVVISDEKVIDKTIRANWQNFYQYLLEMMAPDLKISELRALQKTDFENVFLNYESRDLRVRNQFSCGIILRRPEDKTEDQMYAHTDGSEAYNEFLKCIGTAVPLFGFIGNSGGLDTTQRSTTGEKSLHTIWNNLDIMYHVSTMMPSGNDGLISKKRYFGNNIVLIIFQEHGCDLYDVKLVSGQFVKIVIVVQALPEISGQHRFRLGVVRLVDGIPAFGPEMPYPPIFTLDENFKNLLLNIVITGQLAVFHSNSFVDHFLEEHTAALMALISTFKKSDGDEKYEKALLLRTSSSKRGHRERSMGQSRDKSTSSTSSSFL